MRTILVVEDHENLGPSLKELISLEGFHVELAHSLKQAREVMSQKIDLIVLDWMLPDGQGIDFLIEIRKQKKEIPIIFLTARTELIDKVLGLEMGANDYLTKPFDFKELAVRIRVQLRDKIQQTSVLTVGILSIDRVLRTVRFNQQDIDLVKKEFDLLVLFAESPGKVFSRDEILNKVWGYDVFPTTRTVDTHVLQLRQKTSESLIETVRSVGYRLKVL